MRKWMWDKWWAPILVLAVSGVVLVIGSVHLMFTPAFEAIVWGPETYPPDTPLYSALFVVGQLSLWLTLLSPVFVYADRKFVAAVSDWTPSRLYYLMVFPYVNTILSVAYIIQRHRYVGIP